MQIARNLFILGEPDQLAATMEAITAAASGDWTRNHKAEAQFLSGGKYVEAYCFTRQEQEQRPAADLMVINSPNGGYFALVWPTGGRDPSSDEANTILEEFYRNFVCPAVARTGAVAELTDDHADLEHWLSADTAAKLRRFNGAANRHSGSRHPAARKLWYDFLAAAHREETTLDASTLAQWLREDGGWDEEWAEELAGEYGFARGLLAYTDQRTAVGV